MESTTKQLQRVVVIITSAMLNASEIGTILEIGTKHNLFWALVESGFRTPKTTSCPDFVQSKPRAMLTFPQPIIAIFTFLV